MCQKYSNFMNIIKFSKYKTNKYVSGIGLIEIVVGVAIISVALAGIITAFNLYLKSGFTNTQKAKAVFLAEEGVEALRFIRDNGWTANITSLSTGVTYYFEFSDSIWKSTTTPEIISNRYSRSFVLDDAYRRVGDSDLVASSSASSKAIDSEARQATVKVIWGENNVIEMTTYLMNLFE